MDKVQPTSVITTKKKRIEWIDIAKGFSIILVVYGHSGLSSIPYVGDWFGAFRMPFFFFVSGLLFNPDRYVRSTDFIKSKWPTLIRPFIIFSLIVFACFFIIDREQFSERLGNFVTIGWGGYALWFIPVLVMTEFVFLLICKILTNRLSRTITIIILSILGFITYKLAVPNIWNMNFVLTSVLFFGLGCLSSKYLCEFIETHPTRHFYVWIVLLFLVSMLFIFNRPKPEFFVNFLGGGILTHLSAIAGAVMLCMIAAVISRIRIKLIRPAKFAFKYMGKNSYVVLTFHQIILIALGSLELSISGSLKRTIMWVGLVLLIELITRYCPWILGRKYTKQVNVDAPLG